MSVQRLAAIGTLAGMVAGCAWFSDDSGLVRDTSDDYLEARQAPPLVIPDDIEASPVEDTWAIPEIEQKPLARLFPGRAPRPDAIFGADDDAVKIQKLAGRQWLVMAGEPSTIWPVVKQFLADNGIATAAEFPAAGRIDGEWLAIADEDYRDVVRTTLREGTGAPQRTRIRFKLEHGIRQGSSELHVRYEHDVASSEAWPDGSPSAPVEEKLLHEFGAYYGAGIATESVSMVSLDIASERKAIVERDAEGHPVLRLNVDFERAWAVIGQALQRAEVTVKELERNAGTFHVEIDSRQLTGKAPSLFSRILPGDGRARMAAFHIRIAGRGDSQLVRVFEPQGRPASQDVSQQILVMLREFAA